MFVYVQLIICVAASVASGSYGFLNPVPRLKSTTKLFGNTKFPPLIPTPKDISYGEESRKYRRTVYSHDDWVKHRAPDRFVRNVFSSVASGIYKNVGSEIAAVTAVSALVVVWNACIGFYTDFSGVQHPGILHDTFIPLLTLPLAPFTLLSTSLGLLLGEWE